LVKRLRALPHCVDVPIVVITVVDDRKVRYDALEAGATDFLIKPLDEHETRARCANLLELRRHKIVLPDQARMLQYQVDKSVSEIHERKLETLAKLAKAGEFRDKTTGNHLQRMARFSALIGHNLCLGADMVHVLEVSAPMHDIGKIGIPDSILIKEGPLTAAEITIMQTHPRIGYDILKGSPSKYLGMGAIIALGHHEKFDGTGYPNGLHGEDIPIAARVVAVADVFDAPGQRALLQTRMGDGTGNIPPQEPARQALRCGVHRRLPCRYHEGRGDTSRVGGLRGRWRGRPDGDSNSIGNEASAPEVAIAMVGVTITQRMRVLRPFVTRYGNWSPFDFASLIPWSQLLTYRGRSLYTLLPHIGCTKVQASRSRHSIPKLVEKPERCKTSDQPEELVASSVSRSQSS
jgi:hypothetical protein